MLRAISSAIRDHGKDYWTGTIYTTNRRVWEYDNAFKEYLRSTHATGIDMETATLLTAGFANQIPTGALLMISDKPMEEDGVKTEASDRKVTQQFVGEQVMLGVEALQQILDGKKTIRHIPFLVADGLFYLHYEAQKSFAHYKIYKGFLLYPS